MEKQLLNWENFGESEYNSLKAAAKEHKDISCDTYVLLPNLDSLKDLTVEVRLKPFGEGQWAVDADVFNKTKEDMYPLVGFLESNLPSYAEFMETVEFLISFEDKLHIGIICCDRDPQWEIGKNRINYYIAADDKMLEELTARTDLLEANNITWQEMIESDDYINMYVNAYPDHTEVFLEHEYKEYSVPLTVEEESQLKQEMKKMGMDIQQDLKEMAYEKYKEEWIKDHISDVEMTATEAAYENDEEAKDMTFEEYVEEYGFANGMLYACFDEFLENEYKDIVKESSFNEKQEGKTENSKSKKSIERE